MIIKRAIVFSILLMALLVPPLSTESIDCSKEAGMERWLSNYRHMPMSLILMHISTRKTCGILREVDIDALHSFHETRGCSRNTPFGEYIQSFVDGQNAAKVDGPVATFSRRNGPSYKMCARAELLELPKNIVPLIDGTVDDQHRETFDAFWAQDLEIHRDGS